MAEKKIKKNIKKMLKIGLKSGSNFDFRASQKLAKNTTYSVCLG